MLNIWNIVLATVSASPTIISTATRVDRVSVFEETFVLNEFPAYTKLASGLPAKAIAPDQAFVVEMTCDPAVSTTNCDLAKKAFENTGQRIASVLIFNRQIVVRAYYHPFCAKTNPTCSLAARLGSAVAASSFAVDKDGQTFLYPQALIKQLNTDKELEYSGADILAEFNSDQPFFFRNNGQDTPKSNEYDFEFVVAHELSHGLGFKTGLLDYSAVFSRPVGYLAPLIAGINSGQVTTSTIFTSLQPLDIFDSFVVGQDNIQFRDIGKSIATFPKQSTNLNGFLAAFESSGIPYEASRTAYATAQGPTVFRTSSGQTIPLYSPSKYAQGSSGSHLVAESFDTADFLMVPALRPGITLESLMAQHNATVIYGPAIRAAFQTIGWPTNEFPTPGTVNIATGFNPKFGAEGRSIWNPILIALTGLVSLLLL